jgi:hypothetical protein
MTVDPVNRGHVPSSGPDRAAKSAAGKKAQSAQSSSSNASDTVSDKVELSSAAQELRELAAANRPESNTLSPERMKEILGRIADGFYDKPEVIDEVARRVETDL